MFCARDQGTRFRGFPSKRELWVGHSNFRAMKIPKDAAGLSAYLSITCVDTQAWNARYPASGDWGNTKNSRFLSKKNMLRARRGAIISFLEVLLPIHRIELTGSGGITGWSVRFRNPTSSYSTQPCALPGTPRRQGGPRRLLQFAETGSLISVERGNKPADTAYVVHR